MLLRLCLSGLLLLCFVACSSNEGESNTNDSGEVQADSDSTDYSFSITIDGMLDLSEANATVSIPLLPGVEPEDYDPAFEVEELNSGIGFLRVEFADEVNTPETAEVRRVTVNFSAELDGESKRVGCGSTEGTPDDAVMEVTNVTDNFFSGSFTITLTGCDDYFTGQAVGLDSVVVQAQFTDVPFLPEK